MASVESIGACSLDFETSATDNFITAKDLTASECTLHSNGITPTIQGVTRNGNVFHTDISSVEQRTSSCAHVNGHNSTEKRECTVAEIKLPSYVSISCAINGYPNYSRFCRSRDNSPARSTFRKSSLEPSMLSDRNCKDSYSLSNSKYSRSQSDSNGIMQSVFTESKHVTVSKQLQIPLKSTRKYTTEVTVNGHSVIAERTVDNASKNVLTNGHTDENLLLAKEVGNGGTKSLVQQRIESLYGKQALKTSVPFQDEKLSVRSCNKSREPDVINLESTSSSHSSVTNAKTHIGTVSPPVFRHLNEDFRKQLQQSNFDQKVQKEKPFRKTGEMSMEDTKKLLPEIKENGFQSIPNGIGHDECDRIMSKTPPPVLSNVTFISSKREIDLPESEREGYQFLNTVDVEKEKIQIKVKKWEEEFKNNPDIPEEACGKIRAACGKANLLISQKFEQFKGLCWKNIEENPTVPFYTTASDLAGFWDMVMLQVDDINSTFKEIEIMKNNDWKETISQKPLVSEIKLRSSTSNAVSKSNPTTPKRSAKSAEMAKAREEARRQLLAAKKKGRQQNTTNDDIAIFTPATS